MGKLSATKGPDDNGALSVMLKPPKCLDLLMPKTVNNTATVNLTAAVEAAYGVHIKGNKSQTSSKTKPASQSSSYRMTKRPDHTILLTNTATTIKNRNKTSQQSSISDKTKGDHSKSSSVKPRLSDEYKNETTPNKGKKSSENVCWNRVARSLS